MHVRRVRLVYWWLYVPVLSWLGMIVPLILPPVPLGPVAVSFAWNRTHLMPWYRRGRVLAERPITTLGFPLGWLVNVLVNCFDCCTLGLRPLFETAALLSLLHGQQHQGTGTPAGPGWLWKWLLITNVGFLVAYVVCPGLLFERFVVGIEQALLQARGEVGGEVASSLKPDLLVRYADARSLAAVVDTSHERPVLLYVEEADMDAEPAALHTFEQQLALVAHALSKRGPAILWSNLHKAAPPEYDELLHWLREQTTLRSGWYLVRGGKVRKEVESITALAGDAACRALGVPPLVRRVTALDQVEALSRRQPVLLFTVRAERGGGELFARKEIVNEVVPPIMDHLRDRDVQLCFANVATGLSPTPLSRSLAAEGRRYCGCLLLRDGQVVAEHNCGKFTSTSEDYVSAATELLAVTKQATAPVDGEGGNGSTTPTCERCGDAAEVRRYALDGDPEMCARLCEMCLAAAQEGTGGSWQIVDDEARRPR